MEIYDNYSLESKTKVIIFQTKNDNTSTETYIYLQDLFNDGEILFNIDYETNHFDESFENGNGMVELEIILGAYGFKDYEELSAYFLGKYKNNKDAYKKIISDIKSKGIEISVDESVGF